MSKASAVTRHHVLVVPERCKGCGFCIEFCPEHTLFRSNQINTKGYYVVGIADRDKCTDCNTCGMICPDFAINVSKVDSEPEESQK